MMMHQTFQYLHTDIIKCLLCDIMTSKVIRVGGGSGDFVASYSVHVWLALVHGNGPLHCRYILCFNIRFTEGMFNFHKINSESSNIHAIYMLSYLHVVKYYEWVQLVLLVECQTLLATTKWWAVWVLDRTLEVITILLHWNNFLKLECCQYNRLYIILLLIHRQSLILLLEWW